MSPTLSIVVACRNERDHIQDLCEAIATQDLEGVSWEAILADGCSDDGTREKLQAFCKDRPNFQWIDNPERIVSTGLNRAITMAQGEIIIRMDAHTHYAADYCRRCLETLQNSGAENVGGPARTRAKGLLSRAIAAAFHSPFSTGGGKFHNEQFEGWVDTVPYGCWPRALFQKIGLFDETLVRNQDDELNLRIVRTGGRIWQSREIISWYQPRSSLTALFRQYLQYGFWKVAVIRKHRMPGSWRHLVPAMFVCANLAFAVAATLGAVAGNSGFASWAVMAWMGMLSLYLAATLAASNQAARQHGWTLLPYLPVVFATYHVSYGLGFLAGILAKWLGQGRTDRAAYGFTRLSR